MSLRDWCIEKTERGNTLEWFVARSVKLIVEVGFSLLFGAVFGWVVHQVAPGQLTVSVAGVDATAETIATSALLCTVLIWVNVRCDYTSVSEE